MAKFIFDFDGVLVQSRLPDKTFLWQQTIDSDLGLSKTVRDQIFKQPEWNEIICGQTDFRNKLTNLFSNSNVSADDFIQYWLEKDLNWYMPVLDLAAELKSAGHTLYIGTNQDRIRSEYIRAQPEIGNIFTAVFPSCDLGISKPNPEFYSKIVERVSKNDFNSFIVIDDDHRNIEAAKKSGLKGIYFNPDLEKDHTADLLKTFLGDK
jgi:putative hydrolase of the HAD superfamily